MTRNEVKDLIMKNIAGQGNQVDIGSILPIVLNEIIDLSMPSTGIERIELECNDDTHIVYRNSTTPLTYDEVKELVDDTSKFVTLKYLNIWWMLPAYDDGGAIEFTSTDIINGHAEVTRVIMETSGSLSNYTIVVEDVDHKTNDLAREKALDGHDTYPTTHAVNEKNTEQDEKLSELEGKVIGKSNYTKGFYLDSAGSLIADSNSCVSELIPATKAIYENGIRQYYGTYNSKARLIEYDKDGGIVDTWGQIADSDSRIIKLNTNTTHIRFSFTKGYDANVEDVLRARVVWEIERAGGIIADINSLKEEDNNIKESVIELSKKVDDNLDKINNSIKDVSQKIDNELGVTKNFTEGFYLDINGLLIEDKSSCVSELIPATKAIYENGIRQWYGTYNANAKLIEYNANGDIVDTWGQIADSDSRVIKLNTNTTHVRFSFTKGYNAKVEEVFHSKFVWETKDTNNIEQIDKKVKGIEIDLFGEKNYEDGMVFTADKVAVPNTKYSISKTYIPVSNGITWYYGGADDTIFLIGYNLRFKAVDYWGSSSAPNKFRNINSFNSDIKYIRISYVKNYDARVIDEVTGETLWKPEESDKIAKWQVPDYYKQHLSDKEKKMLKLDMECGKHGDSFIFITDTHVEANTMHSPSLIKHIVENTNTKKLFQGGDFLNYGATKQVYRERIMKWMSMYSFTHQYITLGNHDKNTGDGSSTDGSWLTNDEMYATVLKPMEEFVDLDNKPYYFIDNKSQKIRYFFLDGHWPSEVDRNGENLHYADQLAWMEEKAREIGNEWSIVVIQHILYSSQTMSGKVVTSATLSTIGQMLVAKLDSMADNPAMPTIIAAVGGHTHYDWSEYSAKGYPIIVTNCDATWGMENDKDIEWYEDRAEGTINEQCFDVFHINKTERKIQLTRVGFGNDREFTY